MFFISGKPNPVNLIFRPQPRLLDVERELLTDRSGGVCRGRRRGHRHPAADKPASISASYALRRQVFGASVLDSYSEISGEPGQTVGVTLPDRPDLPATVAAVDLDSNQRRLGRGWGEPKMPDADSVNRY